MNFNNLTGNRTFWMTIIGIATLVVYLPVLNNGFVMFDDKQYLLENSNVINGINLETIKWAFTSFYASNWHPLTWLSHILDIQLFDLNPVAHHSVNLLLHLFNSAFLLLFLEKATGAIRKSAVVALLFALHPLHVESVAWIAERKDLLSTFFWLSAMLAYLYYTVTPTISRYLSIIILFSAALMSKPMPVTFPFLLLLLDYWPLKRLNCNMLRLRRCCEDPKVSLLVEKIPFLLLSAGSCIVTYIAQKNGGAVQTLNNNSFFYGMLNIPVSYISYVFKMFWPSRLAVFYPFDVGKLTVMSVAFSTLALLIISILVIFYRKKCPYLPVGWFWYLGTLVPVIGFVMVGAQAMADRYSYVPLIGLFMMIVWGGSEILLQFKINRQLLYFAVLIALLIFARLTWIQLGHWRNSETLFKHALNVTKNNYLAHLNIGEILLEQGKLEDAKKHLMEALTIEPKHPRILNLLGLVYGTQGDHNKAQYYFKWALSYSPKFVAAHYNLGLACLKVGNLDGAKFEYNVLKSLDSVTAAKLLGFMEP
jgi:hypothetical protein